MNDTDRLAQLEHDVSALARRLDALEARQGREMPPSTPVIDFLWPPEEPSVDVLRDELRESLEDVIKRG